MGTQTAPSGVSPAELERQKRSREASSLNEEGLRYWNQQNWAKAAEYFRKALEMDPNRPVIRDNLRKAEELFAEGNKRQEQARQMDEAKQTVGRMLGELSADFDGSKRRDASSPTSGSISANPQTGGSLEFMGPKEPLFSKGSQTSAPVDLRFMDQTDTQVVDPRVVKGQMTAEQARKEREKDARVQASLDLAVAAVNKKDYDSAISLFKDALKLRPDDRNIRMDLGALLHAKDQQEGKTVRNPKVEAILDAFEYGRGDWGKSLSYLQEACKANPRHQGYRDAFTFVQGMSGYFLEPSMEGMPANRKIQRDMQTKALVAEAEVRSRKRDYENAVRYYRQAHERNPNDLAIRDMLHFTEGRSAAQQPPGPFDPSTEDSKALLPAVSGKEK